MEKLLGVILGLFFAATTLASGLSYDQIAITPQAWQEVDLTYVHSIDGREYTEHANLLRPISWIKQNHLDKVGSTVHLTKEQLGIYANVKIIAIKPTKLDYSDNSHKYKPVIATFITHSNDVWDYTFKDQDGHTEVIHAVSAHPFYSADRQAFTPIGKFKIGKHVGIGNNNVYLSNKYQNIHKIKIIYNFEVYQQHNYLVGNNSLLVHNPQCTLSPDKSFEAELMEINSSQAKILSKTPGVKSYGVSLSQITNDDDIVLFTRQHDINNKHPYEDFYNSGILEEYTINVDGKSKYMLKLAQNQENNFIEKLRSLYTDPGLHPTTEKLIRNFLSANSDGWERSVGIPGLHAEVTSFNRILYTVPEDSDSFSRISIATHRVSGKIRPQQIGKPFPACYGCSNIIPKEVRILTGRL